MPTELPTPRRRAIPWRVLAPVLIVAAVVIAYGNSLHGPFIFDDLRAIPNNPSIRSLWPLHRAMAAPAGNTFAARPVVNLSFAINYALFGLDVRGYHATNVAIHLMAALVLFGVVRRTLRTPRLRERFGADADGLAAAVALLWATHPMLTEAVTYTSTRTESLMGLFLLLTVYCAARAFESPRSTRWRVAAFVACAIGMGCKEVMVAAPLLVWLYDALLVENSFVKPLRRRPVFYASLAATWVVTPVLLMTQTDLLRHTGGGAGHISPWRYALTQSGVIVHYFRLALWPDGLAIDHFDWPIAASPREVWPQLLIVLAALAATTWGLLKRRPAAVAGAWVFLILAPTSSIVPLGSEVVAERRMYLPMIALITLIVLAGRRWIGRADAVVVAALVIALTVATIHRNGQYATAVGIWADTVEKRPRDMRALSELARVLSLEGRTRDARQTIERVLAIDPTYPGALTMHGTLLIAEGDNVTAVQQLRAATVLDPRDALAHTNLGLAVSRQGDADGAMAWYQQALRIDPNFVDAHVYLADLLLARGDRAGAVQHLEAALRAQPDAADISRRLDTLNSW